VLAPGDGTRLTYTEQSAYFDRSFASAKGHNGRNRGLLEKKLAVKLEISD
jgi:hypothetical protein